ncbi:MAG: hypothetical protein HGA70_01030 [Chlorobiaceae bacterium]|nr:hypothetical protein [Chlorobiaceae bacterium]NTW10640.1 hypothetical protein [Chlorobiaceae bacterium]
MKKATAVKIASLATLGIVPMMFSSQDAQAIPAFARKYATSCYTCHSGFPTRNAFGEAFRNNGYRWPGGEDDDHAKQEQTKMGSDGWKKTFPSSPWPVDIPGFAPFAFWIRGNIVGYTEGNTKPDGTQDKASTFNWGNSPLGNATLFFGGSMGNNFSAFGSYNITASTTEANGSNPQSHTTTVTSGARGRVVWAFQPGINLALGNGFSDFNFGSANTTYAGTFPNPGTGAEFSYIAGEKSGGVKVILGAAQNGTASANEVSDMLYARVKYKIGGAGLLSGAGGTLGNEYVGIDDHFAIGASYMGIRDTALLTTGAWQGETGIWGVDAEGSIGNFMLGAAYSHDVDLGFDNYRIDGTYFVYPWLKATVTYANTRDGANNKDNDPTVAAGLTAHLRANALVSATYTWHTRDRLLPAESTTQDTFVLGAQFAF